MSTTKHIKMQVFSAFQANSSAGRQYKNACSFNIRKALHDANIPLPHYSKQRHG